MPKKMPDLLKILVPDRKVNILVMGLNHSYDEKNRIVNSFRSDTMILLCADPYEDKIKLLSIPRDSIVNIPGSESGKINKAYAIGKERLAIATVSDFLNVHIDGYVTMLPNGINEIVDSLGGIKINVAENMFYKDSWGHLYINIKKGAQTLNGSQAQGYVRFRHDKLGDIGRIKRQQEFLFALFRKLSSPASPVRFPFVVNAVNKSFRTDLSFYELLRIGNMARMCNKEDIILKTVPGASPGEGPFVGAWVVDEKEKELLIDEMKIR